MDVSRADDVPRTVVEIYRISPGQHVAFLKLIAMYEALKRMGAPTGANSFVEVRKLMAEHTDTVASGPTTAADWLKTLDQQRDAPGPTTRPSGLR